MGCIPGAVAVWAAADAPSELARACVNAAGVYAACRAAAGLLAQHVSPDVITHACQRQQEQH